MQNRHAKPTIKIPDKCPKCNGYITQDISFEHGKPVIAWRCVHCGLTSESGDYASTVKEVDP